MAGFRMEGHIYIAICMTTSLYTLYNYVHKIYMFIIIAMLIMVNVLLEYIDLLV